MVHKHDVKQKEDQGKLVFSRKDKEKRIKRLVIELDDVGGDTDVS